MNRREYLFVCLNEELAEAQKEVSKILRFGVDDFNPNDTEKISNMRRLERELTHVNVIIEWILKEMESIDFTFNIHDFKIMQEKREKLAEFMEYSKEKGCLDSPE